MYSAHALLTKLAVASMRTCLCSKSSIFWGPLLDYCQVQQVFSKYDNVLNRRKNPSKVIGPLIWFMYHIGTIQYVDYRVQNSLWWTKKSKLLLHIVCSLQINLNFVEKFKIKKNILPLKFSLLDIVYRQTEVERARKQYLGRKVNSNFSNSLTNLIVVL